MIYIELALSCWTLYAIRLFGQGKKSGAVMALLANTCWISMWVFTEQYGIIPLDFCLMLVYWERLIILLKGGDTVDG